MTPAALADALLARRAEVAVAALVAGFDGFVDERLAVPGVAGLAELGGWVSACSGRNGLREAVVLGHDAGGCAVNLADGAAALGVPVDLFATLGEPFHPAFAPVAARVRTCTSWAPFHGRTLAIEGADGKAMLSTVRQLAGFDPAQVEARLADGAFTRACAGAAVIAFTDWTLYPHMTACWRLLAQRVLAGLPRRPRLYLDLVDPSSRSREDRAGLYAVMRELQAVAEVALSVNRNELGVIGGDCSLPVVEAGPAFAEAAAALRERLGIAAVVVHSARWNALAEADRAQAQPAGPFCEHPRKTTGAGDRFNAGYCLGWALGLAGEDRLRLGAAVSGRFIRDAASPGLDDVAAFLRAW